MATNKMLILRITSLFDVGAWRRARLSVKGLWQEAGYDFEAEEQGRVHDLGGGGDV